MNWLKSLVDRFDRWWWHDPIAKERRRIEVEARAVGGVVKWD